MRAYQIKIEVTDVSTCDKNGIPQVQKYHVYADSNNFYEALAKANECINAAHTEVSGKEYSGCYYVGVNDEVF